MALYGQGLAGGDNHGNLTGSSASAAQCRVDSAACDQAYAWTTAIGVHRG